MENKLENLSKNAYKMGRKGKKKNTFRENTKHGRQKMKNQYI